MTFDLFLFSLAMGGATVAILIAGWAYLFHKRSFWKIREWEIMCRDGKTIEALQAAVENEKMKHKEVMDERARLTGENASIAVTLAKAREDIRLAEEAKAFLGQNQRKLEESKTISEGLANVRADYNGLCTKRESVYAELVRIKKEITELEAKADWLKKQDLEADIQKLTDEKSQLEHDVNALMEMDKELNKVKAELEKKLPLLEFVEKDLSIKQRELEVLEASITMEEERLRKLNESVSNAEKRLAELENQQAHYVDILSKVETAAKGTVEIRFDAFKGLYKPVFDMQLPTQDMGERDSLDRLIRHVNAKRFKFSQRLLYAFHTALKASDISCLTVMAGVSGTGKSALPKLYAEAMGMHLCMLSVEPRWDSPRDLFGFFNYMENRYEPTQLARALIQFDEFGQKGNTLKDQMLLVLLDEMNLARIEYYFSEYLSKLELRRELISKINDGDADAQRKVSMELFSGWKQGKNTNGKDEHAEELPIHLYAGTNVLFTGTMNEDETTQSLSDKVIDRANVLHFGRPAELQADQATNNSGDPAPGCLSRSQWSQHWCKPLTPELVREYIPRLNELNSFMAKVNRPFAHRTSKAIMAYIANYPGARTTVAFADQIAMRIMPKLSGLDLETHRAEIQTIQNFIRTVEDASLRVAFDNATNSNHGFFRWQGIDWDSVN